VQLECLQYTDATLPWLLLPVMELMMDHAHSACATHCLRTCTALNHLHNLATRFYCPQTFLYLDFQYRDDISESNETSLD